MELPTQRYFDVELFLARAGRSRKPVVFHKGQVIFSMGDRSDAIYFIKSGSVKLTVTSAEGREAVLGIRRSGDFVGEEVIDPNGLPRGTDATALAEVHASRIGRNSILGLLNFDQDLWNWFSTSLVRLLAKINEQLADSLLYASEQRLARVLVLLVCAPGVANRKDNKLLADLSQQDLANMIGVTRQRVNFLMKKFSKLGFIDYSGGLRIHESIRGITAKSLPGK
jgi:CRP-like cAMP-binding protein